MLIKAKRCLAIGHSKNTEGNSKLSKLKVNLMLQLQSKIVGAAPSLRREQIWQVELNMMIIPQIWIYDKFSCVPLLDFYYKAFFSCHAYHNPLYNLIVLLTKAISL